MYIIIYLCSLHSHIINLFHPSFYDRFHMTLESAESIKCKLRKPLQSTSSKLVWGVKGHTNAWGLKNIVQAVNPEHLIMRYQEVIEEVVPTKIDMLQNEEYVVSKL